MTIEKTYLGDHIYASFQELGIVGSERNYIILTTEDDELPNGPSDTIYINDQVLQALNEYVERLKASEDTVWKVDSEVARREMRKAWNKVLDAQEEAVLEAKKALAKAQEEKQEAQEALNKTRDDYRAWDLVPYNQSKEQAINIVLDNTNPSCPVFVEIENDEGLSIDIGKQSRRDDGLWNIRITSNDIIFHKDT